MLNWRPLVEGDLNEGLAICPECAGDELVGSTRALDVWRRLMSMQAFGSAVVETDTPITGHRLLGIGAAVFVTQAFADQEVGEPQPGLNARIIRSIDARWPVVVSDSQLRSANADSGLDLVILCASWRRNVLDSERQSELESLLAAAFFRLFAGWRFRQMIREGVGRHAIAHIESQRIFGAKYCFDDSARRSRDDSASDDRALFVCTRAHALAVPGSVASILFGYREPILGLGEQDQELLRAALAGATDKELACTLDLKLPTLKKRWATVFHHISVQKPDLLPDPDNRWNSRVRGPQKRHVLLDYLRDHPEELRPSTRLSRRGPGSRKVTRR